MSVVDSLRFAEAFLRNPAQVGAIAPSSPFLRREMLDDLQIDEDQSVIEFGPGTGAFTGRLGQLLPHHGQYLGIERDERMTGLLRRRHPHLKFVHGSAEDALQIHEHAQIGPVAAIISGLPFASLEPVMQERIVNGVDLLLAGGGEFRTFQYAHAYSMPGSVRFRRLMTAHFGPARRSRIVLRNLPPACVLTWRR